MDASERLSELVEVLRRDGRVDVAAAAAEFERFVLTGQGKTILEKAGIRYLKAPRTVISERAP